MVFFRISTLTQKEVYNTDTTTKVEPQKIEEPKPVFSVKKDEGAKMKVSEVAKPKKISRVSLQKSKICYYQSGDKLLNLLVKNMKKLLILSLFVLFAFGLFAQPTEAAVRVRGYYKPNTGTYVSPYFRSSPNSSRFDNYSTRGNYNPYTGRKGYTNSYRW